VHGDSFEFLSQAKNDPSSLDESIRIDPAATTVFASPPWGGVNYKDHDVFDLSTMEPYNLEHLYEACRPMEHVLFLPRTSDVRQIAKLAPDGAKIDVVQYCMEGASKAMVAYMLAYQN
jgi:trimethylguanosine synthase